MTGYGRGYYGDEQLAKPPRRGGSGWVKLALVVGVGAVVWLMWPRRPGGQSWPGGGGDIKLPPSLPPPEVAQQAALAQSTIPVAQAVTSQTQPSQLQLPQPQAQAQVPSAQVTQFAQSRGYPSAKEYEDAVVASARQLKDSGAQVMLAPHLAHLAPRLGP